MSADRTRAAFSALLSAAVTLATPLAAAHADPAPKDTLSVGMSLEPPVLDPALNPAEPIRSITNGNIFEGLTRINEDGQVRPALATSWTVSPDGLRYEFHLAKNVRFHDRSAFDCQSVRFSLNRAVAADSINPQKQFFTPIKDISCPEPDDAVITLQRPVGSFVYDLAWPEAAMRSAAAVVTDNIRPVGTGPYRFGSWTRGDNVTLVRNDDYRGPKPAIATVTFRFTSDPLAAFNAMQSGALDAFPSFPSIELLHRFDNDPRFTEAAGTFPIKVLLALNEAHKPFDDLRVRRALAYAIDRKAMLEAFGEPGATVIGSHMSPGEPDFVDLSDRYPYDPDKAKALLSEAGVPPGTTIEIKLPPLDYARKSGELIAAYLEAVGLHATLAPLAWPQWLSQVYGQAGYEATIIAHTEPHDLDIYARPHYYFNYHDKNYDALYEQYENSNDPVERHDLSAQLQRKLADDEPNVFLFSFPRRNVWNARLHGMWRNQPIPAIPIAGVFWSP